MSVVDYLKTVAGFRRAQPTCGPERSKYMCFEEFVLEHGHPYQSQPLTKNEWRIFLTAARSALRQVRRKDFPIKMCFSNSQRIVLADPSNELRYAEGYVSSIIPIHHGWVDLNGKVIDVTLRTHPKYDGEPFDRQHFPDRAIGEIPACRDYYGLTFADREVTEFVEETSSLGSLIDDPARGWPLIRFGRTVKP